MKLEKGKTAYHKGKKYVGEIPDKLAEEIGLKKKKPEKPKTENK